MKHENWLMKHIKSEYGVAMNLKGFYYKIIPRITFFVYFLDADSENHNHFLSSIATLLNIGGAESALFCIFGQFSIKMKKIGSF